MQARRPPPASGAAWTELLHAEVAFLLAGAGVRVLHIKGPTVAQWLYPDGSRPPGDVDVLVSPTEVEQALDVLRRHGFVERFTGVDRAATTDHAVAMYRDSDSTGRDEVDVHDRFPGCDADPAAVFELLWRRREPAELAHVAVWFPDVAAVAVLTALNAARSRSSKTREDLARLVRAEVEWDLVVDLAQRVDALPGLRAALELDPGGARLVETTALRDVEVSPEWAMRLRDAPRTALRLDELGRMRWVQRPGAVLRWLFPPPAVLRMRTPGLRPAVPPLAGAYVARWVEGLRGLPAAVRAYRATRRSSTTRPG